MFDLEKLKSEEMEYRSIAKLDGIADPGKYWNAPERILFVGKEPWDSSGNRYTNQRDTLNYFCTHDKSEIKSQPLKRANKLASFILEPFEKGKAVVLDRVAWINVKKSPNTRSSGKSNPAELYHAYDINVKLLFQQIHDLNPTLVFFGNTFNLGWGRSFYNQWEESPGRAKLQVESFSTMLDEDISAHFDPAIDLAGKGMLDEHIRCYYEQYDKDACLFFEMCHFQVIRKWHYESIPRVINYWRNLKDFTSHTKV